MIDEAQELTIGTDVITYHTTGKKKDPAVLLVQGPDTTSYMWREIIKYLSSKDYFVVSNDLIGQGNSSHKVASDYSHPAHAQRLFALLEHLEKKQVHIIAHNSGANIALHLVMEHPDLLDKLVLLDAQVETDPTPSSLKLKLLKNPSFFNLQRSRTRSNYKKHLVDIGRKRLRRLVGDPSKITIDKISAYTSFVEKEDWEVGVLATLRDSVRNVLPKPLSSIKNPVHIIWGRGDEVSPVELGHELERSFQNAKLEVFAGSNHVPIEDEPLRCVTHIIEFLSE